MSEPVTAPPEDHRCPQCGARLTYVPGSTKLRCDYCGAEKNIPAVQQSGPIEETDYRRFLSETDLSAEQRLQVHTVKCPSCGAESTLRPNVSADRCPFCDSGLAVQHQATSTIIKPRYLLPFNIDAKAAKQAFSNWLKSLWFAPGGLTLYVDKLERLQGVYVPYWTYDANTRSDYIGERGVDSEERYTEIVDGKTVERTRIRTDWYGVTGCVTHRFDDVLVVASKSLPDQHSRALEPWDLQHLVPYDDGYLSGFRVETYQVGLEEGFGRARTQMGNTISQLICADIGGNHQRIHSVNTDYQDIRFKHILLPIWISAYRYSGKVYRFVINARTGEVQGERPYSWIKITLAVLAASALAGAIWYFVQMRQGAV